ncbi:uncharacterized protein LOC132703570 [Cylas formicarius]|uniref:uncharacterized protein LOC132703570 n=1 Tax=Cylas formicarius TaxID=197179 RepID=UPI00295841EF|nr:uncharacterized protein LOC132703570 [Cylas formicarius]
MGCVNGKPDINNKHPNIFNVLNVNDQGRAISHGKLEVTESDLVFHQRGMNPTRWPLRSLRKYGFDTDVFSFECGRRSPTGPGIYAFRCHKAEQLFNVVQHHITGVEENPPLLNTLNQNSIEFAILPMSAGPAVCHSGWFNSEESYFNPVQSTARSHNPVLSRPGSISSNGQISPTTSPLAPLEVPSLEFNNNRRSSVVENSRGSPSYANISSDGLAESSCHIYMNTNSKAHIEDTHCYENVNKHHIENLHIFHQSVTKDEPCKSTSIPNTPTVFLDAGSVAVREVNYAELELDLIKTESIQTSTTPTVSQSITTQKCYATIDFPKTVALLQSINPKVDLEEGSRKTRHNSTINSSSD